MARFLADDVMQAILIGCEDRTGPHDFAFIRTANEEDLAFPFPYTLFPGSSVMRIELEKVLRESGKPHRVIAAV
jgi:hypothetical protein